jgi:hypothetical protein
MPTPTDSTANGTGKPQLQPINVTGFTNRMWIIGNYLPVLIAVIFRNLWLLVYADVRLMNPFFQMTSASPRGTGRSNGLSARTLVFAGHQTSALSPYPLSRTLFLAGSWPESVATFAYFAVSLATTLASELLTVSVRTDTAPNGVQLMTIRLTVRRVVADVLAALLAAVAAACLVLVVLLRRARSGIAANPSSIATAAVALGRSPELVADLRRTAPGGGKGQLAAGLGSKRYCFDGGGSVVGVLGSGVECHEQEDGAGRRRTARSGSWCGLSAQGLRTFRDVLFALVLLGTLGFVIAYLTDNDTTNGFNTFMNSQSFGPKFLMTALGSLIHGHWARLDRGKYSF